MNSDVPGPVDSALLRLLLALLLAGACACAAAGAASGRDHVFFDDGGEHPDDACERRPRAALERLPGPGRFAGYRGSRRLARAEDEEAGIDAWEHHFTDARACEAARRAMNAEWDG